MECFRASRDADLPFLREMLYEAVFWRAIADGTNPPFEEALADPEVGKALVHWGERDGDTAVVALVDSVPAGAAWYRFFREDNHIRGYLRATTPTVVMAVHRDFRRQGIGQRMLEGLIGQASRHGIPEMSLMVSRDNHALKLYRKCGFLEYADAGDSLMMVRNTIETASAT